jgi:hypothetical protein
MLLMTACVVAERKHATRIQKVRQDQCNAANTGHYCKENIITYNRLTSVIIFKLFNSTQRVANGSTLHSVTAMQATER